MAGTKRKQQGHFLIEAWYAGAKYLYLLFPFMIIYWLIITVRRVLYSVGLFKVYQAPVPVIVIGNLTLGGTGKTPTVIALAKQLLMAGYRPGIISRGYGSHAPHYPYAVSPVSSAIEVGDEPLLIAKATLCPLVIDANRGIAIEHLLASNDCNVIIADDGLQHYALARDIEIVVVDGQRQFGNGFILPMGPLREPLNRLNSVDFCLYNGGQSQGEPNHFNMQLLPQAFVNVVSGQQLAANLWSQSSTVHAVAGIGNPQRFFKLLNNLGFAVIEHAFADHHCYSESDINFEDDLAVIMTEKDAVKVSAFASAKVWYLPVVGEIDTGFYNAIIDRLKILSSSS